MKKSTITILTLLLIMLGQVQAQDEPTEQEQTQKSKNKMSLQFQGGIAREGRGSMDGYYWSSNFFLPIIKGVIVSPSFSQFTYVPDGVGLSSEVKMKNIDTGRINEAEKDRKFRTFSRMNLSIYFEPLLFFNNLDIKRHQLLIGSGARYQTYTYSSANYQSGTLNGKLIMEKLDVNSHVGRNIVWQGILFQYNYHISKSLLVGLNATFIDHQENFPSVEVRKGYSRPIKPSRNYMALANIGLQFGVKF